MACFWPNRIWQPSWAITASTTAGPTIRRAASNCVSGFCSSRSFGWHPLTRAGCHLEEQIDADILSDGIELELLYLREIREWERDPRLQDTFPYYDPREIVATRVSDILHGDFAPAEARLRSLASLMKGLPEFLQQMQSQLKNPARLYTEQAIADNRGRLELFQKAGGGVCADGRSLGASARRRRSSAKVSIGGTGGVSAFSGAGSSATEQRRLAIRR